MGAEHDDDNLFGLVRESDEPVEIWALAGWITGWIKYLCSAGFAGDEVLRAVHDGCSAGQVGDPVNWTLVGDTHGLGEECFELCGLSGIDALCAVPCWIGIILDEANAVGYAVVGDNLHDGGHTQG